METSDKNSGAAVRRPENNSGQCNRSGRVIGGLLIVAIGVVFLARQAGVYIPGWVLSLETILIALGLYIGFRHSFKGGVWLIPILIGGFLLVDDFYPEYDLGDFFWPLVLIGVGLFIIFRSGRKHRDWRKWDEKHTVTENTSEDYLDSTVVFGGIKKNIISKNFMGGEAVTVFGGSEINLTQADINGTVVVDLTQIFGGTKLIVPAHWQVQSADLVAVFGGVDDKRPMTANAVTEVTNKILILKGTCLLGGIEIRSY